MALSTTTLYNNPNVPDGNNAITLYNTAFASNLTLGQLIAAVCTRVSAILEGQSITKVNQLVQENDDIDKISSILERIAGGDISSSEWTGIRGELARYDIATEADDINSFTKRMNLMAVIKSNLEKRTRQSQEDMIDLQTTINRRDVAISTATNLVRATGQTKSNTAANLSR